MGYSLTSLRQVLMILFLIFFVSGCEIVDPKPLPPPIYVDPVNGVDELYFTDTAASIDQTSSSDEENRRGTEEKPYKTINFAYNSNPKHNGWVILKEGIYSSESGELFPIRLPKSALLKSQGEVTIRGNGDAVFSSQNILSTFAINQSATIRDIIVKPENETAFAINHSSGTVTLENVSIDSCENGVLVSSKSKFVASELTVRNCSELGIELKGAATVRIDDSSLIGNGIGLSIREQVTLDDFISSYNSNNNFNANVNCDVLIDTTGTFDLTDNNWDVTDENPVISTNCENGADLVAIGGAKVVLVAPIKPVASDVIYVSAGAKDEEYPSYYTLGDFYAPYGSITKALSQNPNFTGEFVLKPGSYNVNSGEVFPIVLPDNVHLSGANGVVIQGSGDYIPSNTTLTERASLVIIGNATIEDVKIDSQRHSAIFIYTTSAETKLSNISIDNCGYGVKSIANGSLSLENMTINDCLSEGVAISGTGEFLLRDSTLSNNTIGLSATENAKPVADNAIRNNTFSNNLNCDVLLSSPNTFNLLNNIWDNSVPAYVTASSCTNLNTNIVASNDSTVVYRGTSDIGTVYVDPSIGDDTPIANVNDIYQGDQAHPFKTIKGVFDRYPELRGTISLRAGSYHSGMGEQFPVLVPDGVNIIASINATVTGNGYYEAVGIAPRNVTFVLQGESRLANLTVDPDGSDGILIVNNVGLVQLENINISNCVNGVFSAFNSSVNVNGLSVSGCSGTGMEVSGKTNLLVRNSSFSDNAIGLIFSENSSLNEEATNLSNTFKNNTSCDVKIDAEGLFTLYGNTWDIPEKDLLVNSFCGSGNNLVIAQNSRVNILQVNSREPAFNANTFIQRNSPVDGGLYKESELAFRWSNYQSKIHAIAIWDDEPRFANNGVSNIENVVWYWHSGLPGDPSRVIYEYGVQPQNGSINNTTLPSPLIPGKTYYWVVWGWNSNGSEISEASDIGYFVADPY